MGTAPTSLMPTRRQRPPQICCLPALPGLSNCWKKKDMGNLWSFGPLGRELFQDESNGNRKAHHQESKEKLLENVLRLSTVTQPDHLLASNVLQEAKDAYGDKVKEKYDDKRFRNMLIEDACLFLLVVLSILGAELDFPYEHPIFGPGCVRQQMETWLASIFFVGNQIPFVVVEKLMNSLTYFANEKQKMKGTRPHKEALKRALFEFVVTDHPPVSKPVDVICCLRSVLLGQNSSSPASVWKYIGDRHNYRPSAAGLSKLGYHFEPLPEGSGIRGIQVFKRRVRKNIIHLPVLEVVDWRNTAMMFQCLRDYEELHRGFIEPEYIYYATFISGLIQTKDDTDLLYSRGVIRGSSLNWERLPSILGSYYDVKPPNPGQCVVKELRVPEKSPFFKLIKILLSGSLILIILTYLQTHYTVLGYYMQSRHH